MNKARRKRIQILKDKLLDMLTEIEKIMHIIRMSYSSGTQRLLMQRQSYFSSSMFYKMWLGERKRHCIDRYTLKTNDELYFSAVALKKNE